MRYIARFGFHAFVSSVAAAFVVFVAPASGSAAPGEARTEPTYYVSIYGPLLQAVEVAYTQWIETNGPPSPSAFSTVADASRNPFVVTFSGTGGNTVRGETYDIPEGRVVNLQFGRVVPPRRAPIGPLTLTGLDVAAFDAIETYRAEHFPSARAFLSATGTWAAFTIIGGKLYVGWEQQPATLPSEVHPGCYTAESYVVDPATLAVKSLSPACPI